VVVVLNMLDVAEQRGIRVEPDVLEAALGVPVIPVVAAKNVGIKAMLAAVDSLAYPTAHGDGEVARAPYQPKLPYLGQALESLVGQVAALIGNDVASPYPLRWAAQKLLEGDREIAERARARLSPETWARLESLLHEHEDAVVDLASARYEWIERMVRAAVRRPRASAISLTERVDRLTTHPQVGLAVLAGILGLVFWSVYAVAAPLVDLLNAAVGGLAETARVGLSVFPPWVADLVSDGILGGVGTVLSLLPILAIFFLAMAILEDVGYLARAAFVADRFMHSMGLHGKSFLPLLLGVGCNVPAALGTRIIESPRARLLTLLLVPLVPCAGRLGVLVLVAGAFFGPSAPLAVLAIMGLNLAVLAITGRVASGLLFQGESPVFIMELPLYQTPNWRTIGNVVWQRLREFVVRAGTVILAASVVVWGLSWLPGGSIESSYLAWFGKLIEPAGRLLGLDWRMMVALLSSFIAKENAVATLAVLASANGENGLVSVLPTMLTPASALAFLAVQTLFIPCVATVAAMRQEAGGWRWVLAGMAYLLVVSLGVGLVIYNAARVLGIGG
jgi:ferrous iron transport protein B